METDTICVYPDREIDTVEPAVYGHFVEHLGGAVYGGIWVGEDAAVDHDDGIRTDVLELLRDISPPVFRWPGGCFADYYDWEDGIGDRSDRPRRLNVFWEGEETNAFGTDEFLRFCESLDAEAFLALNLGTGSPDDALKWVEYCNYDGDTEYARKRAENGHPEPYDVRYWAVGNESWGCGGENDPVGYARDFRRYGNYLRALEDRLPTSLELVGVGHAASVAWERRYDGGQFSLNEYDWNKRFLESLSKPDYSFSGTQFDVLDHLSLHRYVQAGDAVDFTEEEYYEIFSGVQDLGADVDHAAKQLETLLPDREVGVFVDEWGVWHPSFDPQNGEYRQESTVRDALVAATYLDTFNNRSDVVKMANIAMTTNVLHCLVQTDESAAWPTPSYRVFELYVPHVGATALELDISSESKMVSGGDHPVSLLSASASVRDGTVYLTGSNRSFDEERRIAVEAPMPNGMDEASGRVLFRDASPRDRATRSTGRDETFASDDLPVEERDGSLVVTAPPSSVFGVRFESADE